MKLTLKLTKRQRLVHYHSFLTVGHLLTIISSFTHSCQAHPLISPAELNTLGAFSPSAEHLLTRERPVLMHFTGRSIVDICPTPEPQREPTPPPRTTYIVKVYERTVISRTEFPNAIPNLVTPTKERLKSVPLPSTDPNTSDDEPIGPSTTKRPTITPRDQNRLMRLRQDPSVVSLLNMYDSNGQLDKKVFSNTPAKDDPSDEQQVYAVGRPQHQRRGSTLRQLMGKPEPEVQPNSSRSEGEVSWAERLLQYVPWTTKGIGFNCLARERNASSTSLTTASSSAGVRTPQDSNFGQSQSYEDERATGQYYDSDQRQESIVSSTEADVSTYQPAADIVAVATGNAEGYPHTPGRAAGVFEFLTERRKQQESRPLPSIPAFDSRPSSFSGSPSSPQEDHSLEQSQYVRVSRELSPVSKIPRFNGDESSVFDPTASPTPVIGHSRIPRRIDLRQPKVSLDDRLLRNAAQVDQENVNPSTTVTSREHRRKSSYADANKAFIMSPGPPQGDVNGRSLISFHCKGLSAYENQENDWSLRE